MTFNKTLLALSLFTIPFMLATTGTQSDSQALNAKTITKPIDLHIKPIKPIKAEPSIDALVGALIQVESKGDSNAIGDTHMDVPSVGVLQIRPIMVREVNRILKKKKSKKRFKLKDRFSRIKSIEMFMIWKDYHHPNGGFEEIARCWNGGPRGIKNKRTEHYWAKVQLELNKGDI